MRTGAAIYDANRITDAKAKQEARKSQPRLCRNANAQPSLTCPRCQWTFRAQIGLTGHLTNSNTRNTVAVSLSNSASASTSTISTDRATKHPLPSSSSSSSSSSAASRPAAAAPVPTTPAHNLDTQTNTK
nr:unnamed protein product [Spirometra erinaceieuropaei]